jgi:hypothetical protein
MKSVRFALGSVLFSALFASVSLASGSAPSTYVSGSGSDANAGPYACSFAKPCRTFATALAQTAPGGEVTAMDSADYAYFAISQGVTVQAAPGVYAGISVTTGDGVDIAITSTVTLRGLTINGLGTGGSGIVASSTFATLHVDNCTVTGFSDGAGLSFTGSGILTVKNSNFGDNFTAIAVQGASAVDNGAYARIDNVQVKGLPGGAGVKAADNSFVAVVNSFATGNGTGFVASPVGSLAGELNIENCVAFANSTGIAALSSSTGGATVRVSNSTVIDNGTGILNQGPFAVTVSRTNNTIQGNSTNESGTVGTYPPN